jgi:hypothetical protein
MYVYPSFRVENITSFQHHHSRYLPPLTSSTFLFKIRFARTIPAPPRTQVENHPDGTVIEVMPDGTRIQENPNGTKEKIDTDGTKTQGEH